MILGTAGHVDHGKTALVRALTGIDTDRLPEEKRRGITIELGFAPLRLHDDLVLGVVDVPGHEAFVRTMVAGATGIDLALLVVAADEGVMPQTREHLDILGLLGTRAGVVALTKCDLVDDDWLALVEDELREMLRHTALAGAEIVRTSVIAATGLDELRAALERAARAAPARAANDLFRMPVDRAFTVRGTGTVVTGTVWSGMLERDARVTVMPSGVRARVRGIESHGTAQYRALPGSRAAIALAGIDVAQVGRGCDLVREDGWQLSTTLLATFTLVDGAAGPGARQWLRLHLGTAEVGVRVAGAGMRADNVGRPVRLVLDTPVCARAGDRFVVRGGSPLATVGGGTVTDPAPARPRARPRTVVAQNGVERLRALLCDEGTVGVPLAALPVRIGVAPGEVEATVRQLGDATITVAGRLWEAEALVRVRETLLRGVDLHHAVAPLDEGVSLQLLRSVHGPLVDAAVEQLGAAGVLRIAGAVIARASWQPRPTEEQAALICRVQDLLNAAGAEPPASHEIGVALGADVDHVLGYLERRGDAVQVEPQRYYLRADYELLIDRVREALADGRAAQPAALRERLGLSRKFLIPLLEHCDRIGLTDRVGEGRVLRNVAVVQLDT